MPSYSLDVDGSGDNAQFPFPAIGVGEDWALSFWVKPLSPSGGFSAMLDDTSRTIAQFIDGSTLATSYGSDMLSLAGAEASFLVGTLSAGWNHVVYSRITSNIKLYINGTQTDTQANAASASALTVDFGDNPSGGGSNFTGRYADIRVYLAAGLSSGDVTTLFGGGDVTHDISRHWALTEGSGDPQDTSGNNQDGSLNTATWNADIPSALAGATTIPNKQFLYQSQACQRAAVF